MSSTARALARSSPTHQASQASRFWHSASYAALGSVALGVVTFAGFLLQADAASAALLYLFVIVLTSLWAADLAASLVVSIVAIVSLDYFFTLPLFNVRIGEIDAVALIVFSATAFVITRLMSRVRASLEEIQAREATQREQASLLDLTHDTVFVRDMNDVITYWNRGAEELYGWTREEAIGQGLSRAHAHDLPRAVGRHQGGAAPHRPLGRRARPYQARRDAGRGGEPLVAAVGRAGTARRDPGDQQRHHRAQAGRGGTAREREAIPLHLPVNRRVDLGGRLLAGQRRA